MKIGFLAYKFKWVSVILLVLLATTKIDAFLSAPGKSDLPLSSFANRNTILSKQHDKDGMRNGDSRSSSSSSLVVVRMSKVASFLDKINNPFNNEDDNNEDKLVFPTDLFSSLTNNNNNEAKVLFNRARAIIASDFGVSDPSILSDDFEWICPDIILTGILNKEEYLAAMNFFNLRLTFPDLDYRAHDFRLDPNANDYSLTVRFTARTVGTMRGELRLRGDDVIIPPNGRRMVCPPEAISMTFDRKTGKLKKLCSGFVMDRLIGNTGGLCGVQGAATVAGAPPSEWEIYPPSAVVERFFGRTVKQIDEPDVFLAPFPEPVMVRLAKGVLTAEMGKDDPSLLRDDFTFNGPIVGPLDKASFLESFSNFNIKDAFPDLEENYANFRIDPYDPYRVWYDVKGIGRWTGLLNGKQGDGSTYVGPPEVGSMTFDDNGYCTRITANAVVDPTECNTGGLGGVFGIFYATGNSFSGLSSRPLPQIIARAQKAATGVFTGEDVDSFTSPSLTPVPTPLDAVKSALESASLANTLKTPVQKLSTSSSKSNNDVPPAPIVEEKSGPLSDVISNIMASPVISNVAAAKPPIDIEINIEAQKTKLRDLYEEGVMAARGKKAAEAKAATLNAKDGKAIADFNKIKDIKDAGLQAAEKIKMITAQKKMEAEKMIAATASANELKKKKALQEKKRSGSLKTMMVAAEERKAQAEQKRKDMLESKLKVAQERQRVIEMKRKEAEKKRASIASANELKKKKALEDKKRMKVGQARKQEAEKKRASIASSIALKKKKALEDKKRMDAEQARKKVAENKKAIAEQKRTAALERIKMITAQKKKESEKKRGSSVTAKQLSNNNIFKKKKKMETLRVPIKGGDSKRGLTKQRKDATGDPIENSQKSPKWPFGVATLATALLFASNGEISTNTNVGKDLFANLIPIREEIGDSLPPLITNYVEKNEVKNELKNIVEDFRASRSRPSTIATNSEKDAFKDIENVEPPSSATEVEKVEVKNALKSFIDDFRASQSETSTIATNSEMDNFKDAENAEIPSTATEVEIEKVQKIFSQPPPPSPRRIGIEKSEVATEAEVAMEEMTVTDSKVPPVDKTSYSSATILLATAFTAALATREESMDTSKRMSEKLPKRLRDILTRVGFSFELKANNISSEEKATEKKKVADTVTIIDTSGTVESEATDKVLVDEQNVEIAPEMPRFQRVRNLFSRVRSSFGTDIVVEKEDDIESKKDKKLPKIDDQREVKNSIDEKKTNASVKSENDNIQSVEGDIVSKAKRAIDKAKETENIIDIKKTRKEEPALSEIFDPTSSASESESTRNAIVRTVKNIEEPLLVLRNPGVVDKTVEGVKTSTESGINSELEQEIEIEQMEESKDGGIISEEAASQSVGTGKQELIVPLDKLDTPPPDQSSTKTTNGNASIASILNRPIFASGTLGGIDKKREEVSATVEAEAEADKGTTIGNDEPPALAANESSIQLESEVTKFVNLFYKYPVQVGSALFYRMNNPMFMLEGKLKEYETSRIRTYSSKLSSTKQQQQQQRRLRVSSSGRKSSLFNKVEQDAPVGIENSTSMRFKKAQLGRFAQLLQKVGTKGSRSRQTKKKK